MHYSAAVFESAFTKTSLLHKGVAICTTLSVRIITGLQVCLIH